MRAALDIKSVRAKGWGNKVRQEYIYSFCFDKLIQSMACSLYAIKETNEKNQLHELDGRNHSLSGNALSKLTSVKRYLTSLTLTFSTASLHPCSLTSTV